MQGAANSEWASQIAGGRGVGLCRRGPPLVAAMVTRFSAH